MFTEVMDAYYRWDESANGSWSMPLAQLTEQVSGAFTAAFNDMDTYVKENIVKFIIGERPLSEWDSYVSERKAIGEQTVVDIMQAALDRYYVRMEKYGE